MDEKALFLKFWEKEAPAMRKVIERVPEGSDYKPDEKSRTAKDIAWQIVREEITLGEGLAQGFLDWKDIPAPATMKEVLAAYDRDHAAATKKMQSLPLEGWTRPVPFKYRRQGILAVDWIRARVGVFLRSHSSSRSVDDVSEAHGREGAADLRSERRRAMRDP